MYSKLFHQENMTDGWRLMSEVFVAKVSNIRNFCEIIPEKLVINVENMLMLEGV